MQKSTKNKHKLELKDVKAFASLFYKLRVNII